MHFWTKVLLLFCLTTAALGQTQLDYQKQPVRISKLVIESNGLSPADRRQIVRTFQGKTYPRNEIGHELKQMLRSMGYLAPVIEAPLFFPSSEQKDVAKVVIGVNAGTRTALGTVRSRDF